MTFLFADIEGSTKLAHALSQADWAALLAQHDTLVDATVADHGGAVVKHEGDGTFAAFPDATVRAPLPRSPSAARWLIGPGPARRGPACAWASTPPRPSSRPTGPTTWASTCTTRPA